MFVRMIIRRSVRRRAVRGLGHASERAGQLAFGGVDKATGKTIYSPLELVRLTIPRRVYTDNHMNVVAKSVNRIYEQRDTLHGMKIVWAPEGLKHFTGSPGSFMSRDRRDKHEQTNRRHRPGASGRRTLFARRASGRPDLHLRAVGPDPARQRVLPGRTLHRRLARRSKNAEAILKAGGSCLRHVVKTTVFLQDIAEWPKMNEVYAEFFKEEPPSRSAFQVAALPLARESRSRSWPRCAIAARRKSAAAADRPIGDVEASARIAPAWPFLFSRGS